MLEQQAANRPKGQEAAYRSLRSNFVGEPLTVSMRELAGALPASELTHDIAPYPGRLVRHIPKVVLGGLLTEMPGATVYDPFCGSGTVPLEALRLGGKAIAVDQNPVASLISRVKTTPLEVAAAWDQFSSLCGQAMRRRAAATPPPFLAKWYSPPVHSVLARFATELANAELPGEQADFLGAVLVLAADRLSVRDRRIPVPVRGRGDRAVNGDLTSKDAWALLKQIAWSVLKRISTLPESFAGRSLIVTADARDFKVTDPWLPSVVFTSPPYGAAQKYLRSTSLGLGWLGHAPAGTASLERSSIGREHLTRPDLAVNLSGDARSASYTDRIARINPVRGKIYELYFHDMRRAVIAAAGSLSNNGFFVLVCGSNHAAGEEIPTHAILADYIRDCGLEVQLILRDEVRGRTLLTRRKSSIGEVQPMKDEYVYVFRKSR